MSQIENAVATRDQAQQEQAMTVARFISGMSTELQRALPRQMDGDRLLRVALTLIRASDLAKQRHTTTVSLSDCTPESFAACLLSASALGLEPGVDGQAWLIPYTDKKTGVIDCTLQVGYQGARELAYRHPRVSVIRTGIMLDTDRRPRSTEIGSVEWIWAIGQQRLKKPETLGMVIGYWAVCELTNGGQLLEVLSADEVAALRSGRVGPSGSIKDPQRWMERKTVLKQVLKTAPRSIEIGWLDRVDERPGGELYVQQIPQQIAEQVDHAAIEAGEHTEEEPS